MPPESSCGYFSSKPRRPTSPRRSRATLRRAPAVEAEDFHGQHHVVEDGAPGQEHGVLEHDTDVPARLVDGLAAQGDAARRALEEAGENLEEGGLAAARLSHDGDEFARFDLHGDAGEGLHLGAAARRVGLLEARDHDQGSTHGWGRMQEDGARRITGIAG